MTIFAQVPDRADEVVNDVVDELARLTLVDWVVAILVVLISVVTARFVGRWLFRTLGGDSSLHAVTGARLARALILAVGVAIGLMLVGVELAPIVFFLVVLVFLGAVSFGPALADYMAGIVLTAKRPFDLYDLVTIQGFRGVVIDHDLRAVTIRSVDREDVTIPNRVALAEVIVNVSSENSWRTLVPLRVGIDADLVEVRALVLGALADLEDVAEPPSMRFRGMGDSWVEFDVLVFHRPNVDLQEQLVDRVVERVHGAMRAGGLEIPVPTRDVRLHGGDA